MRRLAIFISLTLLCCGCASVQPQSEGGCAVEVARVPDEVFRNYLMEQGYAEPYKGLKRHFGFWVPRREVLKRTAMGRALQLLNVHDMGIQSLQGVEMFDSLVVLICSENPLDSVDLSHCPRLKQFSAIETPLKHIDLSHCPQLKLVEVSYTQLQQLDVSHNPLLEEIYCIFSPGITAIDISHNPHLQILYIRETRIREVDITANPAFRELHALDTPLETIIVTSDQLDRVSASVEDSVKVQVLSEE
jgi:Leucine-rich repeat (LRR) protein